MLASAHASDLTAPPALAANGNDNRTPAGEMKDGVLSLHLELIPSTWYPEQQSGKGFPVFAFAEKGKAPQIPGPFVRVQQGTKVNAEVHNTLTTAMFIRGFPTPEPVPVAPGGTARIQFVASTPGTFYYSARSCKMSIRDIGMLDLVADLPMGQGPFDVESQLEGGFVVDPPGTVAEDRIFMITTWLSGVITPPLHEAIAINGRSWPYTERLSYRTGDSARWRLINASISDHAMHLHGFHFQVNSVGDQDRDHPYTADQPVHAVTQRMEPGTTASILWVPSRAGRWLFHCHMTGHMVPNSFVLLGHMDSTMPSHSMPTDSAGMMGMILGITVTPGIARTASPPSTQKVRQLKLFVRETPATESSLVRMGYVIQEGDAKQQPAQAIAQPLPVPGAPLILTRGEPTEITVVNELKNPTSVHWHGIELESYYDGVPNYGGNSPQMTPAIPPGGSFVARMTPTRAGTFIYHPHWHDVGQLTNGLYGPIIVLEPGQKFDPEVDKVFIVGRQFSEENPASVIVLNGTAQPDQMALKSGTKYRLRFINIATNDADVELSLLGSNGQPIEWRSLAKDGWELPAAQATTRPAFQPITVGETYDFELQPESAGELTLQVRARFSKHTITQVIRVK
ncbi:MAG TPA: multicopper oxidase domain-containing protein [Terriglobales bacterium]|nr:multicopper oxidase domain-containing protein [Terriglobales bacterium]